MNKTLYTIYRRDGLSMEMIGDDWEDMESALKFAAWLSAYGGCRRQEYVAVMTNNFVAEAAPGD